MRDLICKLSKQKGNLPVKSQSSLQRSDTLLLHAQEPSKGLKFK